MADTLNKEARDKLVAAGMTYTEIEAADLERMRAAVKPLYEKARQDVSEEGVDLLLAAIDKCV